MMQQQQKNQAAIYLLLILSMLFWGTSYVFSTICLQWITPVLLVTVRLVISSAMLWIFVLLLYRRHRVKTAHFKWLFLLAFFEPFMYFIGETYGLQRVNPIVTSLMISTIPIFTAIAMRIIFHERLTKLRMIGILISFMGIVCMLINREMQLDADGAGLLFLLLAILAAVAYGLVLNKLASNIHPVWLIAIQNTLGALYFIPCCLIFDEGIHASTQQDTVLIAGMTSYGTLWICIFILSVFSSSLAFIFYSYSVRHIGIARSNVFTNLIPIFTALTSLILLNELLTPLKALGILIVISGLALTQRRVKTISDAR
jgi:drug/metabolite transporter (DMT)-like permease